MKQAFTLAEVLITLGIIGVVAVITIPALIQKQQKRVAETVLKEDYSIIQQAVKFAEYDGASGDMDIPDTLAGTKNWFETFLLPYLKLERICYDTAGCWQSRGATKNLAGGTANYNRTGIGVGYGIIIFKLTNGSNICIDGYDTSDLKHLFGVNTMAASLAFYVDVNGDKLPNVIGKDIYILVCPSNGLVPAGINETDSAINANCSSNASGNNAGYYCLMKVKNNGWVIDDKIWRR